MKIELIVVGKTTTPYLKEGIEHYVKRLTHYVPYEIRTISDIKTSKALTAERQKEMEGEFILQQIQPGDRVVLLDEHGREMTSREFAGYLEKAMSTVGKRLLFVVGGPYGFSKKVYDRADGKLSLSQMTFSHEMIRLFFTEQVYRAMTILRGEPYHHD
ncbi:23S rRNA (pseudouridine(1915)-N(3))-methyltransferase RlmH [Muribaculum intestinale]|jgi:23S rRNA (pseudouridine1915-N3)-methyltransferase|uniref:23S rRNA (pseudouridine(1915)-N(3))-methyltransferase RlmH n=1 Tax=Muribaculum intestinale TaxID=1796646 RepID=UPI0010938E7A|nr:23S rRNA (pseudouridine(1915)-N(3))-methyltransferase RlmH [Muribaculum intestinale]TGX86542.1 23S rRNA (pseudouridine(1915)-N(3))-methyltransferase RlmH [Muribaculum intestinale]